MTSQDLALAALSAPDEFTASRLRDMAEAEYARELLNACRACDLHHTRTNAVPWSGWAAPIILVGEAPGREEDLAGEPFVGRSGKLLRALAREAGLVHSGEFNTANSANSAKGVRYSLANTIGCRPPNNDYDAAVRADAPARCRVHLERALDVSRAWIVVGVGRKAQNALDIPHRGGWSWVGGRLASSIYHPAYLLRLGTGAQGRDARDETVRVLRRAAETASVGAALPMPPKGVLPDVSHLGIEFGSTAPRVDTQGITKRRKVKSQRELFEKQWKAQGWVLVSSRVLGERVVIRRMDARVPTEYAGLGAYQPEELAMLRGGAEEVRRYHAAKVALGGEFVT